VKHNSSQGKLDLKETQPKAVVQKGASSYRLLNKHNVIPWSPELFALVGTKNLFLEVDNFPVRIYYVTYILIHKEENRILVDIVIKTIFGGIKYDFEKILVKDGKIVTLMGNTIITWKLFYANYEENSI
jgi:hypothetical protein